MFIDFIFENCKRKLRFHLSDFIWHVNTFSRFTYRYMHYPNSHQRTWPVLIFSNRSLGLFPISADFSSMHYRIFISFEAGFCERQAFVQINRWAFYRIYSRTRIYRISADCEIYPIYAKYIYEGTFIVLYYGEQKLCRIYLIIWYNRVRYIRVLLYNNTVNLA